MNYGTLRLISLDIVCREVRDVYNCFNILDHFRMIWDEQIPS